MSKVYAAGIITASLVSLVIGKEVFLPVKQKANRPETAINCYAAKPADKITIVKKWQLPDELKEVSGIDYIDANRFACIMDEKGIIYIYNTTTNSVEKQVPFWGSGDFEGIAVAGKTIYAIRSNGIIYSIANYNSAKPIIKEYKTHLTKKQNTEGLCYDGQHNRLLITIKGNEPNNKDYKGIYAFNLQTNKLDKNPVLKINLTNELLQSAEDSHKLQPSDLAIHPLTGDLYILDGEHPRLLILNASGKPKLLHHLPKQDFALPEGITFSKKGELFISNEGKLLGSGNILKVEIEK